ncbi:MAG: penicillin acylase family protein [Bacteroidota bacterium]|nr:penicillin acylase family protein [Candidatus Kapabacteria bacterium]MDW8220575.1 penicillin acylase family protein [Bacteroidota bacterium]
MRQSILAVFASFVLLVGIIYGTSRSWGTVPPIAFVLDVWNGVYKTARLAHESSSTEEVHVDGLAGAVRVYRDQRNVPHILARTDLDAIAALGYLVAQERLFQMDFQTRIASGRLAEILGESMIKTDKFLRRTGMMLGAEHTWEYIQRTSPTMQAVLEAFTRGVNAYIARLTPSDYPFEFRLLDYAPEAWSPIKSILVNQLMAFDLTFQPQLDDVVLEGVRRTIGDSAFTALYPQHGVLHVPQSPEPQGIVRPNSKFHSGTSSVEDAMQPTALHFQAIAALLEQRDKVSRIWSEHEDAKGSNNWVISGTKTQSGKPLLAGDPHLSLSLPSIWYEVQMCTPTMNVYGVTIPGAPLIIIGFNDCVAWSPTNTGADVVDFYALQLDSTHQKHYWYNGQSKPMQECIQPLRVKGVLEQQDTLLLTHWGPIITVESQELAVRWTAHEPSTVLEALWHMNHAKTLEECHQAQRFWDVPAQNIVVADTAGNIALRSAGYYPIRKCGHGRGIHNGSADSGAWIGRVPFDSVPGSVNPSCGWLSSSNQAPTLADYPYYLNYNWGSVWRSRRIRDYLDSAQKLTWQDCEKFQTDVKVMQWEFLKPVVRSVAPHLHHDIHKNALQTLLAWDGRATKENNAALLFHIFIGEMRRYLWDEMLDSAGNLRGSPADAMMYYLVRYEPESRWFDYAATHHRESAHDIVRMAMLAALDTLTAKYGTDAKDWMWGKHHRIVFRHLTRSGALQALWRGPYPFGGFQSTVLPAGNLTTTHSASWRMVVDFASGKPVGWGVFPGGTSGNPFSNWYDAYIPMWLQGKLYALHKVTSEQECMQALMRCATVLSP